MDCCSRAYLVPLLLPALVRSVLGALPPTRDRSCLRLSGAVAPQNRSFPTLHGRETALGIVRYSWASSIIEQWIYRIVVEEVLGVNAEFTNTFPTSPLGFWAVAGCKVPETYQDTPQCRHSEPIIDHVVLGIWDAYAEIVYKEVNNEYPDLYPLAYGTFDYPGRDSIFAPEPPLVQALAEEHLPLEYYKSYSHPSINLSRYFSSPWAINGSRLMPCEATRLAYDPEVRIYLQFSKDTDGVVLSEFPDGSLKHEAVCYREFWWLAPACRNDPDTCIPFITGGDGWHIHTLMQKAAAWDLPVAIACAATYEDYASLPMDYTVLFYWWFPDPTMLSLSPVELLWPPHNSLEWRASNQRTHTEVISISKWAHHGLLSPTSRGFEKPLAVLEKFSLTREEIWDLMLKYVKKGSTEEAAEQIACEWLTNNTDRWMNEWIPMDTACQEGQGLVNSAGSFTNTRSEAQECEWCPSGQRSLPLIDREGFTHICQECSPGHFQEQKGATTCVACPRGTSASSAGAEVCERCDIGSYAAKAGQADCTPCPSGFITEFQGAVSEADCVCAEGSYRDGTTRLCEPCKGGMECKVGSDELALNPQSGLPTAPVLLPAYWSSVGDPLNVFACENEIHCIGGLPGQSCGERLVGQACAHCQDGYRWNYGQCRKCHDRIYSTLLFPVLPLVGGPITIVVLYLFSTDTYRDWGSFYNGMAAAGFIVLHHYQVLAVIRGTNIAFPGELATQFDYFMFINDFTAYFDANCAGVGSFQSLLVLQSLVPGALSLMYLLVWLFSQLLGWFDSNLKMDINRMLNGLFSLMFTFFAGIASTAFTIFKCGPNPNGTSSLIADRSVTCYDNEWFGMVGIGILAVALWCVGFGAILCHSIWRAPKDFHNTDVQMRWKFLFIRYRPDGHWWALTFIIKSIALNLGFLFMRTGLGQIWWIVYVLTVYTGLACIFRPWRHMNMNLVDIWAHLALVLAACALTWFAYSADDILADRGSADRGMTAMIQVVSFSVFAPALCATAYIIWCQKSASALAKRAFEVELIASAYDTFIQASDDEQYRFMDTLIDWDFWFLFKASGAIHMELTRRRCRRGYSWQRLGGSVSSTCQEVLQRRGSRLSQSSQLTALPIMEKQETLQSVTQQEPDIQSV